MMEPKFRLAEISWCEDCLHHTRYINHHRCTKYKQMIELEEGQRWPDFCKLPSHESIAERVVEALIMKDSHSVDAMYKTILGVVREVTK